MRRLLFALFSILSQYGLAQVTINITSVPVNTPASDNIFIAGTFNNWNPGSSSYQLTEINSSFYTITLGASSGTIEFKFTRGSWDKVECNADGSFLPNRTFTYGNGDTLDLTIAGWEDLLGGSSNTSTALPNVSVMAESFFMPQLNRYRKIWIYLPDDYDSALNKYYPVIYMQDGQNIFDDSTSFAGEWKIDETLHELQMNEGDYGCIVVGIENGGIHRINEYSPYHNSTYGGGQGDEYCDFIVSTLKPYVDSHYRTLTTRDYTAVAGSSMGGLISFYAAMKFQDVFSKAGVFSPSFWFDDSLYTYVESEVKQYDMKFYFCAGRNESATLVDEIKVMYDILTDAGFNSDEMDTVIEDDGQHAEWFWAREFPDCYEWLFANIVFGIDDSEPDSIFKIVPNPAQSKIYLQSKYPLKKIEAEIYDVKGEKIFTLRQSFSKVIDISRLKNGFYLIKVKDDQSSYSKIFEVQK